MFTKSKGFTLIELLVVIAIIALLASVVLVALNSSRQKARVAKRLADLSQIAKALELYYDDNKAYPSTGSTNGTGPLAPGNGNPWRSQCSLWGGVPASQVVYDTALLKGIVPTYANSFPTDPAMNAGSNQNCYLYSSSGTDYKLLILNLTDMTLADLNSHPELVDACRGPNSGTCSYSDPNLAWSISTPRGRWW
jgi:prepilin-type N-terminal cleavage/methylation domain-containing protein